MLVDQRPDLLKRPVGSTDVSVNALQLPNGQFQWTLKTSECNELGICMAIERIRQVAGLNVRVILELLFVYKKFNVFYGESKSNFIHKHSL